MNKKIESALTQGLLAGYAGGTIDKVDRGRFSGNSSHVSLPDGVIYHDEWFATHSGGGQELVKVGDLSFTRLYAGGTPDETTLSALGITTSDVGRYLVKKISELAEKTRLTSDCRPDPDGEWQYEYRITGEYPQTHVTTGLETIEYNGTVVHHHAFILSPIQ
jgi:hypothetical protein